MNDPATSTGSPATSEQRWEKVRVDFMRSMMIDTPLFLLAENAGLSWDNAEESDTPTAYIDLSWGELLMLPEFTSKPGRAETLIDILQETLAFDDPFGDMVDAQEVEVSSADEVLKPLRRLEIPEDFPIALTALSSDTKEFCEGEEIHTLEAFVRTGQKLAGAIVVGGDMRALLNALAHVDEDVIAQYLPFRKGHKGLHLVEAIGLSVDTLDPQERQALAARFGYGGTENPLPRARAEQLLAELDGDIEALCGYFKEEAAKLREQAEAGDSLERPFVPFDNPERETVARGILMKYFRSRGLAPSRKASVTRAPMGGTPPPVVGETPKRGFFSRLFGLGRPG